MDESAVSKKLLLAVSPALLADALSRALQFQGLDVVLYTPEHHAPAEPHDYAVALVTADLPADVSADVVVRLPEVADLSGILQLVQGSLQARTI